MYKLAMTLTTSLLGVGLSTFLTPPPGRDTPPPPSAKKKEKEKDKDKEKGAVGDLRKAYDAIRRIRLDDGRGSAPEERLRDWADRAAGFYRDGLKAMERGDERETHEYGAIAHDLARAANHAAEAQRLDRRTDDLPPPPGDENEGERTARDLRRAYDRIKEMDRREVSHDGRFYVDAARDLYGAARRDAEDGRLDRAGELARAAEAMTHVPEHLGHLAEPPKGGPKPPPPVRHDEPRRPAPRVDLPPPLD